MRCEREEKIVFMSIRWSEAQMNLYGAYHCTLEMPQRNYSQIHLLQPSVSGLIIEVFEFAQNRSKGKKESRVIRRGERDQRHRTAEIIW